MAQLHWGQEQGSPGDFTLSHFQSCLCTGTSAAMEGLGPSAALLGPALQGKVDFQRKVPGPGALCLQCVCSRALPSTAPPCNETAHLNSGIPFVGLESHPLPGDTSSGGRILCTHLWIRPLHPFLPPPSHRSRQQRCPGPLCCFCHGPFWEPSQALNKYLSAEPSGVLSDGMCVFSTLIGVRQSRDSRGSLLGGQRLAHSQRQH